jgi:hypothetical protein
MGANGYKAIWLLANGYWLVAMVIGYVDMSYMNIDYEYWLFTIGYGI